MHKNYSKPKEGLYIDLNLQKFLVIIITVMVSLVIPIQLITYNKANADSKDNVEVSQDYSDETETNQGQVAGISTQRGSSNEVQGILGIDMNLKSKSTQYTILGVFFVVLSLTSLYYLYSTEKNYKRRN
jgi:uncharacterized protein YpmB